MTSAAERILEEALNLPRDARAMIIKVLADSLASRDVALTPEWRAEVTRRLAEVESGEVAPVPWDVAETRIKKSLGIS